MFDYLKKNVPLTFDLLFNTILVLKLINSESNSVQNFAWYLLSKRYLLKKAVKYFFQNIEYYTNLASKKSEINEFC